MAKKSRRKRSKGRAAPYTVNLPLEDWVAHLADKKLSDSRHGPRGHQGLPWGLALIEVMQTRPATPQEHRRLLEILRDLAERARGSDGITVIGEITVPDPKDEL